MVWALLCCSSQIFSSTVPGRDQAIGIDRLGLADAMRAIDGLRFDGGIPPRIVEHHVAGGRQVQAGAGGAQAEQEHGRRWDRSGKR